MCGIFGYVGKSTDVGGAVLAALKTLEYRGYDSWGMAVGIDGHLGVTKHPGKISGASVDFPDSDIGFGHTRWATHGGVTQANAHPHLDCSGQIAVIHNGIIENFRELRDEVAAKGHALRSETDSEVIAHLVEEEIAQGATAQQALHRVFGRTKGLGAVIVLDLASRTMVATKRTSPLVVGRNCSKATIASDEIALIGHATEIRHLEDGELATLSGHGIEIQGARQDAWMQISVDRSQNGLNGFPDYMSKEMSEQPGVLERLVREAGPQIDALAGAIRAAYGTYMVGCGTASYAALTGSYLFSRIASRHVNFAPGSEFKYYEHFLTPDSLVIAFSQSGETADIIEAMLAARNRGSSLAGVVNAPRSTLGRMVDLRVDLLAGPEQCVLSTKAYTAKVAVLLMTAHALGGDLGQGKQLVLDAASGLRSMMEPDWIERARGIAERIHGSEHLFVIGRGLSYPTALEAALKIKEVSYIHAEGFAAGELKHGVIALVQDGTPCVVYAPNDETRSDIISSAMELKVRGGHIIGIGPESDPVFDAWLPTPDVGDAAPLVQALPAQMLGYHAALLRGNDPDKPRNLAKSVTVK
ncbi:MAG TPA: glutamine--fructose-6-phosphate transaminase (isomerizing) [Thermomicrobiales bacterium]|nr:glutamine--fructose-6-phosphate transaminase (isomerizing) [Thermomicrobiales bacterium]